MNQESGAAVADLPAVAGNVTYYAAFSKTVKKYNITWKNYDNTVLQGPDNLDYGTIPQYTGDTPTKHATAEEYYTFSGWSPQVSSVTGAQIYTAQYTETDVTQYVIENGQLKVFDWEQLEYVLADDAPFMLTFQPNGGLFTGAVVPKVKVISATYKDSNGHTTDIEIPEAYQDFGSTYYMQLKDGTYAYVWALILLGCTKVTLEIRDLPAIKDSGINAPPGFDDITAWETSAPYHKFPFSNGSVDYTHTDDDDNDGCYQMEIDRITVDNVRQMTVVPYWVPARDGNLRALAVASGLGSLDFGAIQAIETTYNSRLSVIPIVCYGYTGTFCMDLGVSKTVSITYTRVQPSGTATINGQTVTLPCDPRPDFPVYDSRCWSNAYWIEKLRDFTDRWQLRTNGCTLYLKRPNNPRLTNGYLVNDEPDPDPMRDFVEEINGENCYISSAPIRYVTGCPNVIRNSIKFMMGTLYPKQTPARTIEIEMYWGADTASIEGEILYTSHPERTIYLQYPEGTVAISPKIPYLWAPYYDTTNDTYIYVSRLYYLDNNNKRAYLDETTYFLPTQGMKIYSEVRTPPSNGVKFYTYGSDTVTVKPISSSTPMIITYYLIGGGGGGGGASHRTLHVPILNIITYTSSGGAGGASGAYNTGTNTIAASSDSIRLSYSVGTGGAGGASNNYTEKAPGVGEVIPGGGGGNGDSTTISFNGIFGTAPGGRGGPGATGCSNPGVWTNDITPDSANTGSYRGGNGGAGQDLSVQAGFNGLAPSGQTNYGLGGAGAESGTYFHFGGGGGGGGPIIFPNIPETPQGGDGAGRYTSTDRMSGTIGGGGGGGWATDTERVPGGSGGNGAVYIFVQNGEILDD